MVRDRVLFRRPQLIQLMSEKKLVAGRPSRAYRRKARNLVVGILFFILGVVGVLIPVVPQVPFFVLSLLFLSLAFRSVRRALRRFLHRHPKIAHAYKHWRDRARRKRLELIRKESGLEEKSLRRR